MSETMHQDVLEETAILERRRSNWFLKRGIIKNAKMEKVLFRKNVDLSLIERGFTVPQSAVNSFCENIIGDVPLGSRLYIGLVVDNKTYSVTLSNVGFTSDTGQQMQVRYGPTSPIVDALRMIFAKSHTSLSEGRCPDDKEYVEVIAVTPNIFSLVCHPIDEKSVSSTLPDASLARGSLKQTESYLPGYNEMNIGAYVREKMRQLSDSGFIFTEQQLRDICDIQWSNENLKHEEQYPFATIVDRPFPFKDLVNDEDRYWDQIFPFGDVNLIISKNWHECSRVSFDKWLSTLEAEPSDANNYQEENKYDLLKQWLIKNGEEVICISFSEIANYVGGLPPSAYKCRSFWSNNDSHPFSAAWFDAGYNLAECDLETQYILFEKCSVRPGATCTRPITVEASLIEFSNKYRGQIKTKQEIVEKLSANYGHNKDSILPDEYEAASKNDFSKLFRRIDDGTYECLGYNSAQSSDTVTSDNEKEKTINLIATRFKNGIRKSSNIDFERFKNLYADEYGREFQHDSDWFNNLLTTEAFIYDDRAYIYRDEAVEGLRRMEIERRMKKNTVEAVPVFVGESVKTAFYAWLTCDQNKSIDARSVVLSLDSVSKQLLKRKITLIPLWEITNASVFSDVYSKARDNKFFKIMDKKSYFSFMRKGRLYFQFLKTKPILQTNEEVPEAQPLIKSISPRLTIKEAVIKVLFDESRPMSADEIYDRIVEQDLYAFGAQNPVNVVRTTIEYACDNSGYSKRDVVLSFHFEKNNEGKRVYTLLSTDPAVMLTAQRLNAYEFQTHQRLSLKFWSTVVEKEFHKWLKSEKYHRKTVGIYRRAVAQIFHDFSALGEQSLNESQTELGAVRKFTALLGKESSFVKVNAASHNQFTSALAALERFYSARAEIVDNGDNEQRDKQPKTGKFSSSLSSIVDLEEGKAGIREILEAHFQTLYGYSNISILWNAAQNNLSLFLNDNAINTAEELWRFMYDAFLNEYVMSNPHIWKVQPNYPQSYVGVIINLARQHGGTVTRDQIDEYFAQVKQGSPINAKIIQHGFLAFYAPRHFILTEAVNLSSERVATITKALDSLFEHERVSYIVLRDISNDWFSSLPALKGNLKWTALLLQEVLRLRPAIGYCIVFSGLNRQAHDTLGAAIVLSKSEISTFADVVHRHCYENELLGKRMPSEDLRIILRKAGMLEGNELIFNLHKALRDNRFAFTEENRMVKILER